MNAINKIIKGDKVILIVALILCVVSMIVVYSATSVLAVTKYNGDKGLLMAKHVCMLLFGLVMMVGFSHVNYKFYAKLAMLLMIPCLALLLYTLLFGRDINSATRSINLGLISFQPSEVAKAVLVAYLSRQIIMMEGTAYRFKDFLVKLAAPILLTAALIFSENLSTALIIVTVSMVLLFIGRVKILYILSLVGLCVVGMGLYLGVDAAMTGIQNNKQIKSQMEAVAQGDTGKEYKERVTRIQTWSNRLKTICEDDEKVDPFDDKHMQRTYANIAVASSSVFGKGPGKSQQRNFLPHPYSDFIYAIIVEEYGLVGGIVVLLLYVILFTRVLRIVLKRPVTFGALMAFGLGFLIILQATINMGVSIGLLPVTGQPLPLVSMGGTSLMATGIMLGMILSVTRSMEEEDVNKEQEIQALTEESEDEREPESRD